MPLDQPRSGLRTWTGSRGFWGGFGAPGGARARRTPPAGRVPSLHVVNPAAAALAEDIYAGPCQDGVWWFWWSWAERIAISDDLPTAATLISRVLAARD